MPDDVTGSGGTEVVLDEIDATEADSLSIGGRSLLLTSKLGTAVMAALGPLVQASPTIGRAALERGTYLVKFSGEGSAALANGTATFLRRTKGALQPTLVRSGQLAENATLVGKGARAAGAALAVAHVAVLLAVQAQLVSIERSIEQLGLAMESSRRDRQNERVSKIRGVTRSLAQRSEEMAVSPWTDENKQRWLISLDRLQDSLDQIAEQAALDCEPRLETIRDSKLQVSPLGDTGATLLRAFDRTGQEFRTHHEILVLASLGMTVLARQKMSLGVRVNPAHIRHWLTRAGSLAGRYSDSVLERARDFKTILRRKSDAVERRRLQLNAGEWFQASQRAVMGVAEQIHLLETSRLEQVRALIEVGEDGGQTVTLLE